ncbi:IclR family transcriptional regulator [Bacillus norwichensis]|uniref:IclR family transcriptional regulator n=1 Tax=Bacillus norwichensis TaxID=2762217 RepID=A0ABR8VL80_9BACI|nr:IclR family transcriptional regulator [Bacillus norwichensis]MBD8005514.1 IclR family transcriptional regulator [Bacillus norwichensis]
MKGSTLSSVTNALRILRLFSQKQKELSFTDIVRLSNVPKSSTHRTIATLVEEGFLSRNPRTTHYRLGLAILSLGGVIFSHHELYKEALPIVKRLSEALDESAHICLMENLEVVYLFRVESRHPDRLLTQIGRKNPIHCTSEGLCILAFQDESTITQLLQAELYPFTPYTLTERSDLLSLMADIRKNDYCLLENTYYENYTSIAAPIRDYTGKVVSSLSVIGHTGRIAGSKQGMLIEEIKKAASKISEYLGHYSS